jgi:ADP-heptose synthase, bifunctional sugar kinase/adenylyltransferase
MKAFARSLKTRIIALHQQVVRVDREKILTPSSATDSDGSRAVRDSLKETDAIIFEDYGKGFVTTERWPNCSRGGRGW